jgi:hypothetical protein
MHYESVNDCQLKTDFATELINKIYPAIIKIVLKDTPRKIKQGLA